MSVANGKSVLITGCSSGIGYRAAQVLTQRGYQVIASARRSESVRELRAQGFTAIQLDLASSHSIATAIEQTLAITGGKLYGLFNNGGFGQPGAVEDITRDALREQFETLVFGWHELTCGVLPIMRKQGYGRVIQNSSVLGFVAMPYRGAYNAAKFAIEGLTDTLRLELAGTGVFVSLIEPGPISSDFRKNAVAAFTRHVDSSASAHQAQYQNMQSRLNMPGATTRFTMGPEAVVDKLLHALESSQPKHRYPVTIPTHVFSWLKRMLPSSMMDWVLAAAGGGGKR